jgi:hypothetical protein
MGVQLENAQIGDGRGQHLDDGQRRRVIASQHDGQKT